MVTSGSQKANLGLSLKFEGKSMKVLGYSRKSDQGWEFSEKAVELVREYRVCLLNDRLEHIVNLDVVSRRRSRAFLRLSTRGEEKVSLVNQQ